MDDIRDTLDKLRKIGKEQISESYHWAITNPAEIRAHVMENLVEWQRDNAWESGTFAELLAAYLSALKIDPNESSAMKRVMASACKEMINDYRIWVKEDTWLGFAKKMKPAISMLRQMGLQCRELDFIERDLEKREQRLHR